MTTETQTREREVSLARETGGRGQERFYGGGRTEKIKEDRVLTDAMGE